VPSALSHLTFNAHPDQPITLPPHLQHLCIHGIFNKPLNSINLPSSLKFLQLPETFNLPLENLPTALTELKIHFAGIFNRPVNNLPPTLTALSFGDDFNQPVDNLPPSLTSIVFGDNFNQPIDKLPPCVKKIHFGKNFHNSIDQLPPNLTHLTFDSHNIFDQPANYLPNSLQFIHFGPAFNSPFNMPSNLSRLYLGEEFCLPLSNYPRSLKILRFGEQYSHPITSLPPLTHLEFELECKQKQLTNLVAPPTLTHFTFGISPRSHTPKFFSPETATTVFDFLSLREFYFRTFKNQDADVRFNFTANLRRFYFELMSSDCVPNAVVDINFATREVFVSACALTPSHFLNFKKY
jgi:hypothetical protein